jgi:hypothetical protein
MAAPASARVSGLAIDVERVSDNGDGGLADGRRRGGARLRREHQGARQRRECGRQPSEARPASDKASHRAERGLAAHGILFVGHAGSLRKHNGWLKGKQPSLLFHPPAQTEWTAKENRPRLEPRFLLEDPEKSCHAWYRVKDWPQENAKNTGDSDSLRSLRSFAATTPSEVGDLFDNRLIFGDNRLALKALEQEFTGKINCIFNDSPSNTSCALKHFADGAEPQSRGSKS